MLGKSSVCLLLAAASTLVAAQNSTTNSTTNSNTTQPVSSSDWEPTQAMLDAWSVYTGPDAETPVAGTDSPSNSTTNSTAPFSNSTRTASVPLSTGTGLSSGPLANTTGPFSNSSSLNSTAWSSIFPGLNGTRTLNSSDVDPATNTTKDPSKPTVSAADPRFPPITPCQNGAGPFHGCGKCVNSSAIAPVPLAKANLTDFDNTMFVAEDGSGGGKTWFSVPAVGDQCKVLIFGETPGGLQPPHGLPGVAIAVASNEGCYFANTGAKIAVTFCCGNDECNAVSQGLFAATPPKDTMRRSIDGRPKDVTSIPTRRSIPYQAPSLTDAVQVQKRDDPVYTFFTPSNTYSATSNWVAPEVPQQWCEPAVELDASKEYQAAGAQQFTGNIQTCTGSFCSFSVDVSVQSGSSLETENSETHTQEDGINASATFGWSWGVTATATVGYDHTWSNALSNSTSYSNTTSTTNGLTGSLGVQPGTWAQLALVPRMNCKVMQSTCHNGTHTGKINSQVCKPAFGADGKTPEYLTWPVTLG